jgi:hypothetical protein
MKDLYDIHFRVGDIGLSTDNSWLAKIIKFFTSWQTGNAQKNHCFTFLDETTIAEAVGKIKVTPLKNYEKRTFSVYRIPLTKKEQEAFKFGMMGALQSAYGWFKLPLFALDAIITKISSIWKNKNPVFFFTKYFGITNFMVCSQFVVWGLYKYTDYRLKNEKGKIVSWKIIQPDYMEDLLQLPINKAKKIYEQVGTDNET